ncbi:efflux RND transporter periplasmic adaptor subunit [Adhaeribacter aquaticus]|uniref:efflux RND transporter periplasmic adaptor subunit n=1 Tax=Adhaeribacter aquaticus TaxID=299567 RepID=UPI000425ACAE|nr:efflux RND transporter periplasmic adaptor subunit [Adhaeribacter aquaticus]
MKIKYVIYTLLILVFGALIVYRVTQNKSQGKGGPGGPGGAMAATGGKGGQGGPGRGPGGGAMRVDGIILKPQQFSNNLSVTGSIEANEQVAIRGQVSGLVRSITFQEGSKVKKGQVLVKVDDSELRAQLAQALTRQNLAAENAERARLLLAKEAISREEHDIATAEYRSTQSQSQLIRAQLAKTVITAPFSGRIGLRNISEGAYLSPETVIANLVSSDPVKITFTVPEKYATQVSLNTKVSFTVSGSPEKYTATVYAIEPGIATATRTLQLRARAANPNGALFPGAFATIELPLNQIQDAILVPTQAIVPVQEGKKVFIAKDGKAKEVLVVASTRTAKEILITSGLNAGDTVLTTGILTLKDGAPVKVRVASNLPKN